MQSFFGNNAYKMESFFYKYLTTKRLDAINNFKSKVLKNQGFFYEIGTTNLKRHSKKTKLKLYLKFVKIHYKEQN
jgi:hypothetical protein